MRDSKRTDESGWAFIAVGLVAASIALLPVAYEYYAAIKGYFFFSLIAAIYHCVAREGWRHWPIAAAGIAIALNNPIWPPEFPKWLWSLINFGSVFCFGLVYGASGDLSTSSQPDQR